MVELLDQNGTLVGANLMWTRRAFAKLLVLPQSLLCGQGIATRNIAPQPRGKPSGLPFHARFTDIGPAAGLRAPVIYGEADHKTYILETVGCGAAFLDYDNDGWMDGYSDSQRHPAGQCS